MEGGILQERRAEAVKSRKAVEIMQGTALIADNSQWALASRRRME
jgi:hypothetical protein